MDCTDNAADRLQASTDRQARYGGLTRTLPDDPPIYAALAAEWQGSGRMVPGVHDAEWTAFVAVTAATWWRRQTSADVPRRRGRWERVAEPPAGRPVGLAPVY